MLHMSRKPFFMHVWWQDDVDIVVLFSSLRKVGGIFFFTWHLFLLSKPFFLWQEKKGPLTSPWMNGAVCRIHSCKRWVRSRKIMFYFKQRKKGPRPTCFLPVLKLRKRIRTTSYPTSSFRDQISGNAWFRLITRIKGQGKNKR